MNNLGSTRLDNAKYQVSRSSVYCFWRRRFFKVFTIYGHGGHVGHVTQLICINFHSHSPLSFCWGEPGLVDRVLALHAGSRGVDSHRGHMSEQFLRSNRPGYQDPVSSGLENSGIRVAVGDCSVTERRRWHPPYQTGKTVHVHANTTNTTRTDARCWVCAAMVPYR